MVKTFAPSYGEYDGEFSADILQRQIQLASAGGREATRWKNLALTGEQLFTHINEYQIGKKDGTCILQGSLVGETRSSKAMKANSLLIVDVDTGHPMQDVIASIQEAGLAAVIWTTHSHMKDVSEITERALLQYMKREDKPSDPIVSCVAYLTREKGYYPDVLDGATLVGKDQSDLGVFYLIKHKPMPKYRVLFVLANDYSFSEGGTQDERIEGWKRNYALVCDSLGIFYDKSCTDPARLMYLPRCSEDMKQFAEMHYIPGEMLDLESFGEDVGSVFVNAAGGSKEEKRVVPDGIHPWLIKFVKDYPDFEALEWLRSVDDNEREGGPAGGGAHWKCPNDHNHTDGGTPHDKAFAVFAPNDASGEWGMSCRHATCVAMSANDRLWYLSRICDGLGITDVSGFLPFSERARTAKVSDAVAEELSGDKDGLRALIDGISQDTHRDKLREVFLALAKADEFTQELLIPIASVNMKVPKASIRGWMKKSVKEAEERKKAGSGGGDPSTGGTTATVMPLNPVPDDPAKCEKIFMEWDWEDIFRITKARVIEMNKTNPTVFKRPEGGIVKVIKDEATNTLTTYSMTQNDWLNHLTGVVKYMEPDGTTGRDKSVGAPQKVLSALSVDRNLGVPLLKGVSHVALFDKSGTLRDKEGYDPDLQMYILPNYEPIPVSAAPTDEELDEAYYWMSEAVRDFPFVDSREEAAAKPVKLDDYEEYEGRKVALPNWERGVSSRVHAFCMMIQPLVRNLIEGPTPSYHFWKPSPGTGAGYLADVINIIQDGTPPNVQTMSASNEEFRKSITATLRSGAPIIFLDNINRKVDSGDLAAALTSGVWRDRILGQTEIVTIKVTSMWILAGNGLEFSSELLRRNVPVMMDAGEARPAQRDLSMFKYHPLQEWVKKHRPELIWACQTLVANWFAKGTPKGQKYIHSFDHWSMVMGGIFEAAGIKGFLDNVNDYLGAEDQDTSNSSQIAQILIERFGGQTFKAVEAQGYLWDDTLEQWKVETPFQRETSTTKFSMWFKKVVGDQVFELDMTDKIPDDMVGVPGVPGVPRGTCFKVRCASQNTKSGNYYQFSRTK